MKTRSYRKRPHESAVRTTISLPPLLWDVGTKRQAKLGFGTFSDYIQDLVRHDSGLRLEQPPA